MSPTCLEDIGKVGHTSVPFDVRIHFTEKFSDNLFNPHSVKKQPILETKIHEVSNQTYLSTRFTQGLLINEEVAS